MNIINLIKKLLFNNSITAQSDLQIIFNTYIKNNQKIEYNPSSLKKIIIEESKSQIILNNHNILYCYVVNNFEGLFRKDRPDTFRYGRAVCDEIKNHFKCNGFFTSDELPKYGITRKEKRFIAEKMNQKQGDLIIILSYNQSKAQKIIKYLIKIFNYQIAKIPE